LSKSLLIKNLQNTQLYDYPIKQFKVLETHISWVILTGQFAYKVKKPCNLEFLDFTSLEQRHYYCQEEVRLNKRLAPNLYLDIVPITGSIEQPQIGGTGTVIEYAIKMQEFSQHDLFDRLLAKQLLVPTLIDQLAEILAKFHQAAHVCDPQKQYGSPEQVHAPVIQNFDQCRGFLTEKSDISLLKRLQAWAEQEYQRLLPVFTQRKQAGFIRECHGDVHLGNIVLIDQHPVIFDCIEFNESFRWTDVMADPGFLAMDLEFHQKSDYANRLINDYLQLTGDYEGLTVLKYYKAYRAMVRAKVSLFQDVQTSSDKHTALRDKFHRCAALAASYTIRTRPTLLITHGFSASGKSTLTQLLVNHQHYIQLSADAERKRSAHMERYDSSRSGLYEDLYHPDVTAKNYQRLAELAELVLQAGYNVIVDASFLEQRYREQFFKIAKILNVAFFIIHCQTSIESLQQRIATRQQGQSLSEANEAVLKMQIAAYQDIAADEQRHVIAIDTEKIQDTDELQSILQKKLSSSTFEKAF
jgi:uncharacterized protein